MDGIISAPALTAALQCFLLTGNSSAAKTNTLSTASRHLGISAASTSQVAASTSRAVQHLQQVSQLQQVAVVAMEPTDEIVELLLDLGHDARSMLCAARAVLARSGLLQGARSASVLLHNEYRLQSSLASLSI